MRRLGLRLWKRVWRTWTVVESLKKRLGKARRERRWLLVIFYLVVIAVLFTGYELLRDRWAAWANTQIDKEIPIAMEWLANFIAWRFFPSAMWLLLVLMGIVGLVIAYRRAAIPEPTGSPTGIPKARKILASERQPTSTVATEDKRDSVVAKNLPVSPTEEPREVIPPHIVAIEILNEALESNFSAAMRTVGSLVTDSGLAARRMFLEVEVVLRPIHPVSLDEPTLTIKNGKEVTFPLGTHSQEDLERSETRIWGFSVPPQLVSGRRFSYKVGIRTSAGEAESQWRVYGTPLGSSPKSSAERPHFRVEQGKEESTGAIKRGWGLVVWNDEPAEARGIHAQLEAMDFAEPIEGMSLKSWPTDRGLHWAEQDDDVAFSILSGQSARLNVMYYDQKTEHLKLSYHRTTEQFRDQHALSFDFPVLILINIAAEDRAPVFVVCRLDPKPAKSVLLEGLTDRLPLELLWRGTQRRKLSEFMGFTELQARLADTEAEIQERRVDEFHTDTRA